MGWLGWLGVGVWGGWGLGVGKGLALGLGGRVGFVTCLRTYLRTCLLFFAGREGRVKVGVGGLTLGGGGGLGGGLGGGR